LWHTMKAAFHAEAKDVELVLLSTRAN
jgi:hypothetical protein